MNSQKQAVFLAVTNFYGDKFKNGMTHTSEDKAKIIDSLIKSFENKEFGIKSEQANLKVYIRGLLNNHLTKDTRLNGGDKYVPANPGSRTGISNKQIKAMRQLLKKYAEGSDEHTRVSKGIEAAVAVERAKKLEATIDVENLPEEFQDLVG